MSRTSKKTITHDEMLDLAIIPNTEGLYRIPNNWCWITLSSITSVISKGTTPKGGKNAYLPSGVDFLRVENICDDGTISHDNIVHIDENMHFGFLKRSILKSGDVLVSIAGTLGKTALVRDMDLPLNTNQAVCFIRIRSDEVNKKYIKYAIDNPVIQRDLLAQTKDTAIPNLTLEIISGCPIPFSPYIEQNRIVERIDGLFSKLNEAKEKAQEVIDGFDDRRSAILSKAFSGELTSSWNKRFIISSNGWKIKSFDDVATIKSNLVDPAEYQNYPHIAPDNIEKKTGRLLKYNTIAEDGVKSGKHRFYAGQILYSKIRPNLSKVVVIDFDGLCSADMYPIEAKPGVNTKFLWYYMLSDDFVLQASTAGTRSVLPKINQKELSSLKVRVTSLPEQERIVKILDSMFTKEQQAKETAEQIIEQIEVMKKAILARAFRGELGTNDPNDEPAIDLLRRVINS